MGEVKHLQADELEKGLEHILGAPTATGTVEMIVRRPQVDAREVLEEGELDLAVGLVGDNWLQKGYKKTADGSALVEVTAEPHLGCKKFTARFGLEAMKFVNSTRGKELNLRGINAKVIQPGIVRTGDNISKL